MTEQTLKLGELTAQIAREIRNKSRILPLAPHLNRALRIIAHEPIRPARLSEELGVTPRAVTDVVDTLTELGYVATTPDPHDRRAKIITATPATKELLTETASKRADIYHEVFGQLSTVEQDLLLSLLEKIAKKDHPNM